MRTTQQADTMQGDFEVGARVRVASRDDLGTGEILRITDMFGTAQADIVFEIGVGRQLESFPLERKRAGRSGGNVSQQIPGIQNEMRIAAKDTLGSGQRSVVKRQ